MGKNCTSCLPCKEGLPCSGDAPKIRRITNFAGSTGAVSDEFALFDASKDKDWSLFPDIVNRSLIADFPTVELTIQVEDLGELLKSGAICHRIYLNRVCDLLSIGGATLTYGSVFPYLADIRKEAIYIAGVSVIGGSIALTKADSQLVNLVAPALMSFSLMYLARTYGKV